MAIMALHPDAYGITIQGHIQKRTGNEPSLGSVYAAVERLEEKGFVKSRQGETSPHRGGRRKLHYTVTAPGQATLQESLRATDSLRRGLRWREAFRTIGALA
jgi:DNA-binding PadR family transcriptional regulator